MVDLEIMITLITILITLSLINALDNLFRRKRT